MAKSRDFGSFELHERLASGGMASVYRGVQKSLSRPVVLKILHPHLAEDAEFVTRFEREALAAAPLRHDNIVQIIDCGRHDGTPFIAMELVDGEDLRRSMERRGTPPLEVSLLVLRAIADGLDYAHAKRLVHRDIKPANVMLARDGAVKLTDFGLAKSTESLTVVTLTGSVLGTPAYMSPEQANGEAADERSDLFSLGVVAYEMLGGTRPFRGNDSSAIIHAILTVDPPRLETINPTVPEEIADLVRRMLEKDRLRRPATAGIVRDEIETALEAIGVRRGRALLVEYFADAETVSQRLRKSRRERHLTQGIYYETLGLGRIDDAIREFHRVLFLDPKDVTAREHLAKLERERVAAEPSKLAFDPEATTVIDEAAAKSPSLVAPRAAPSVPAARESRGSFGLPRGAWIAAAVVVALGGGYALLRGTGGLGGDGDPSGGESLLVVRRIENPPPPTEPPPARGGEAETTASPATTGASADTSARVPGSPESGSRNSAAPGLAATGSGAGADAMSPKTSAGPASAGTSPTPSVTPPKPPKSENFPAKPNPPPPSQKETPPAPGIGSVRIATGGTWAYVFLDGRKTGKTTPCLLESIASGPHSLFLVREGFEMTGGPRTITVEGGKTIQVDISMRPQ